MTDRDDPRPETEPRETTTDEESRQGTKPVREYPDEGARSHYPTDPATAKTPTSPQADGATDEDPTAE